MPRPKAGRSNAKARNSFNRKLVREIAKRFGKQAVTARGIAEAFPSSLKGYGEGANLLTWAVEQGYAYKTTGSGEFILTDKALALVKVEDSAEPTPTAPIAPASQPVEHAPTPGEMTFTELQKDPLVIKLVLAIIREMAPSGLMSVQDLMDTIRTEPGWGNAPWQGVSRMLADIARQGYLTVEVNGKRSYGISKKGATEILKLPAEQAAIFPDATDTLPARATRGTAKDLQRQLTAAQARIAALEAELATLKQTVSEATIEERVAARVREAAILGGAQRIYELLEGNESGQAVIEVVREKVKDATKKVVGIAAQVWNILQDYDVEAWSAILDAATGT